MAKLYEISERYKNLEEILNDESIPVDVIESAIMEVHEEFDQKIESMTKFIKSLNYDISALKEEEKRLSARRKSMESKESYLKQYIQEQMEFIGVDKVKTNLFTIGIQNNPVSLDVLDENLIPMKYIKTTHSIDKRAIMEDFKATGEIVEGTDIKTTRSIRIR